MAIDAALPVYQDTRGLPVTLVTSGGKPVTVVAGGPLAPAVAVVVVPSGGVPVVDISGLLV